jgi:hypothetical protein
MLSRQFSGGKEVNYERIQRRYWIPDRDLERVLADYETELNKRMYIHTDILETFHIIV